MQRSVFWVLLLVALFFILVGVPVAVGIVTEAMWFDSLGFESVYWTSFLAKLGVFAGFAAATAAIIAVNLFVVRHFRPRRLSFLGEFQEVRVRVLRYVAWPAAGVIGVLMGLVMVEQWDVVLRFFNSSQFGLADPIFNRDIGFYVFTLPFLNMLRGWLLATLILAMVFTGATYLLMSVPDLRLLKLALPRGLRTHLSVLAALVMLVFAFGFWIANFELLFSTRGVTRGASYTDISAQYIGNWIMVAISVLVAGLFIANTRLRNLRLAIVPVALWFGALLLAIGLYPAIVQEAVVRPNELALEQPYIRYGIEGTRQAFNLNNVEARSYQTKEQLTLADIEDNPQTSQNIRILDYRPLLTTYAQIQEIRTYYAFTDIDIDRYMIDGEYRQVMLSGRHLLTEKLPPEAQTWVNQHIKYTHGYGLALSLVNAVTPEGLPRLLVKDIPPVSSSDDLRVDRPEIYYGTEPSTYVFVKTSTPEFDYPMGDENVFSFYEGNGGAPVGGFLNRLAFAIRFGDLNILLTEYLTADSRIMIHRQIQDALGNVAPFLLYDRDPYLVIADGKLYWIQDAYTVTADYPYSELYTEGIAYIRNSVKIVIDAYDGSMSFYVADESDPLVQTYRKIFPALFMPMDEMPAGIRQHVRYPEDMLNIQSFMYSTFHMQDPQVFYNREDVWTLPQESFGDQVQPMQAYYVIMRPPGEESEDFVLIRPFTPIRRDNLIGWMAAKSDGDDYGKLLVFKFSKQELAYGPLQIEARINQDPTISQQLTLWERAGSKVIRGNLVVIPIGRSLLYVQPLYLQAQNGQLPEMKRVIVATGDNVVMAETLNQALSEVFGRTATVVEPTGPDETAEPGQAPPLDEESQALAQSALDHYEKAQEYLRNGDWASYGQELDAMRSDLEKLVERTGR